MIAICGIDGSGKTTVISRIQDYFNERNVKFVVTQQPTDFYRKNHKVVSYMHNGGSVNDTKELALLSAFDRLAQHFEWERTYLSKGVNVLTHRHVYATYAIFCKRGIDLKWLKEINKECPLPDIVVLLDLPGNLAVERIYRRGGAIRKEEKSVTDLEEIRQGYLTLMPKNAIIIDACKTTDEITNIIIKRIIKEL